jgi:hypothetical protein
MFTQPSGPADPNSRAQSVPFLQITEGDDDQQGRQPLDVLALHLVRPDLERQSTAARRASAVRPLLLVRFSPNHSQQGHDQ